MNTKVTATGMQVKATTAASLVISNDDGTEWGTSAQDKNATPQVTLTPVSTNDLTNWFYVTNPTSITSYTNGTPTDTTKFNKATTLTSYVKQANFKIKLQSSAPAGENYSKLFVDNITVQDNGGSLGTNGSVDKEISKALRVGVKCDENFYIYEPVTNATAEYKAIVDGDGTTVYSQASLSTNNVAISTEGSSDANLISASLSTSPVDVTVFIWYEGQDTACTSFNSVDVENLEVSIDFSAQIS